MDELYSLENAEKFNWSSISGNLNPERVNHLEKYLVGEKILDAGCGGGAYVEFLSTKGLDVTGVDKYDQFLQVARQKGRQGTYIQADIGQLPFSDKNFDCTYCFDVLEHVDDQAALKELARVTSKRIIFTVPQKDETMYKYGLLLYPYQDPTHLRYYNENTIEELTQKIYHSHLHIFSEGHVPLHGLFKEVLKNEELVFPWSQCLGAASKVKLPSTIANKVISKLTSIILTSVLDIKSLDIAIVNHLNNPSPYKKINLGLVAIISL